MGTREYNLIIAKFIEQGQKKYSCGYFTSFFFCQLYVGINK